MGLTLLFAFVGICRAQTVTGPKMPGFSEAFDLPPSASPAAYTVHLISSSIPGNVLWPDEQPVFTFQISCPNGRALQMPGHVEVIPYGTYGAPGDVWTPHVARLGMPISSPIEVSTAPNGFQDVTISPTTPPRFGGYALVLDLGPLGRQFITSYVRTLRVSPKSVEYPHMCLDNLPLPVLQRLGIHAIRWGVSYKPTTDPDFAQWYADRGRELKAYQAAGVTVLFMAGGGDFDGPTQPLGHQRPWLNANSVMQNTKFDLAWVPSYDPDFQGYCYRFARDYGWPRGPITAFSLWNEPWEGISISGWGADMLRYRDIYTHMWQGVDQARQQDAVQVLVGGCDSSTNALDKLFSDGTNTFGPMFDFLSIHYQGLNSTANYKPWLQRIGYGGRVKIWDTESWVGNTDDRVAAVVAGDRAAGYDRAMGVYGGDICTPNETNQRLTDGTTRKVQTITAWSTAAAVGAASAFIGERPFKKLLFSDGLPWVMVFGGQPNAYGRENPEDGTVVMVGDLGAEFGADSLPLRTARGYAEIRHKTELATELAGLVGPEKQKLLAQIDAPETLSGATMTVEASGDYDLYDSYGNKVPATGTKIVVPLDGRGFFLRGNGQPGSFSHLLASLRASKLDGIEPLAVVAHDLTAPVGTKPLLRLSLTNVLNRPVTGRLSVALGDLSVEPAIQTLTVGPNAIRDIRLPVSGRADASNTYPLTVMFTASGLAPAEYREDIHANVIAHRTIIVDGSLDDWRGVLPQTIATAGSDGPTLTEQAWLPFAQYDTSINSGFATAYLAYDDQNFYFAAKVADSTPDPGTVRFATRDDDQYFYPPISYLQEAGKGGLEPLSWPAGVRRYSYRKSPDLPAGNYPRHDNIQIAFNVLPTSEKRYYPTVPGTMPGFVYYQDTDYEYALNQVAAQYSGGTEVWRLAAPNIPPKNFYPRQPRTPHEGPVTGAKLVIRRDGGTLIYECSIPWSEMPEAKHRIDTGQTIKFSYRVNDQTPGPTMELSKNRSVAKRNNSFHADWIEHWANELEFGSESATSQRVGGAAANDLTGATSGVHGG